MAKGWQLNGVSNPRKRDLLVKRFQVPGTGIEPVLPCGKRILSPLRLPVPPPRRPNKGENGGDTRTRTGGEGFADPCLATWLCRLFGAGNGIRTRDPQLGKLMLYRLSYSRFVTDSIIKNHERISAGHFLIERKALYRLSYSLIAPHSRGIANSRSSCRRNHVPLGVPSFNGSQYRIGSSPR